MLLKVNEAEECAWIVFVGFILGMFCAWLNARSEKKELASKLVEHQCIAAQSILRSLNYEAIKQAEHDKTYWVENYINEYEDDEYKIEAIENIMGEIGATGVYVKREDLWLAYGSRFGSDMDYYFICKLGFLSPKIVLTRNIDLKKAIAGI